LRWRRQFRSRGGFQHDQGGSEPAQALHQRRQSFTVPREGKAFTLWPDMHIQPILGHVNANEVLHIPSLRMRARLAAPATVRAEGTDGWGTVLRNGLIGPRSLGAPIRHRDTDFTAVSR